MKFDRKTRIRFLLLVFFGLAMVALVKEFAPTYRDKVVNPKMYACKDSRLLKCDDSDTQSKL